MEPFLSKMFSNAWQRKSKQGLLNSKAYFRDLDFSIINLWNQTVDNLATSDSTAQHQQMYCI